MGTVTYGPQSVVDVDAAARRERLVIEHLAQVRIIATRIHERLPRHIALEDLISSGIVGLLSAIDSFDPSYNVQLNTFAEYRIRGAIVDSLREMDCAPRDARARWKNIQNAIRSLQQRLGREPEEEEIAAELGMTLAVYQERLSESQGIEILRLERTGGDENGPDLLNLLSDDEDSWPSRIVERRALERILALAIERMPKRERTVLSLYYYEDLSLREISQVMGLHLTRCGQLRVQAVLRLRSHMERVWSSTRGGK
jgi:RNA polymerase sigma factor for flagellar operon FliA